MVFDIFIVCFALYRCNSDSCVLWLWLLLGDWCSDKSIHRVLPVVNWSCCGDHWWWR